MCVFSTCPVIVAEMESHVERVNVEPIREASTQVKMGAWVQPTDVWKIYLLFTLSGMAGLMYQVSWVRQLGTLVGFSERANAFVLFAWFIGSLLGLWLGHALLQKIRRPLRAYAWAEWGCAGWACIIPFVLQALDTHALTMSSLLNVHQNAWLFLCGITCILLPTTLGLGLSLPFVAAWVERSTQQRERLPRLYGFNIAGGVLGLMGATFVSIESLGVMWTGWLGAIVSIVCGCLAYSMCKRDTSVPPESTSKQCTTAQYHPMWTLFAVVSGFCSLGFQIVLYRMFSRIFHNSSYTFALVLAVFLLGLSLASYAAGRQVCLRDPLQSLAKVALLSAVLLPVSGFIFRWTTGMKSFEPTGSFSVYIVTASILLFWIVLPPVVASGMILPLTWLGEKKNDSSPTRVGYLTGWNLLGSALGVVCVSMFLLPLLGPWGTLGFLGCCMGMMAFFALFFLSSTVRPTSLALWCFLGVFVCLIWTPFPHSPVATLLRKGEKRLAALETTQGLVEVVQHGSNRMLRKNIHYLMGDTRSANSERNQAHIPLLLHPHPKRVAMIGLATGITAGGALEHKKIRTIHIIELDPVIVRMARFFKEYINGLFSDPRVTLWTRDGRMFFRTPRHGKWDVVISDLFVPWHSHTGYLYTLEHFRSVSQRLRKGGILCQWISLNEVNFHVLSILVQTMRRVFPYVSLMQEPAHPRKIGLIGHFSPLRVDLRRIVQSSHMLQHPPKWNMKTTSRRLGYLGTWNGCTGRNIPINTHDSPRIEFSAPSIQRTFHRPLHIRLKRIHQQLQTCVSHSGLVFRSE